MIEVEIKARINNREEIKKKLIDLGAEFVKSVEQTDIIFGHPSMLDENRMIIEGGYSGRLRQVNNKVTVEFKEIRRGGGGIEVKSPIGNVELGKSFLSKLGFEEAFSIRKKRECFAAKGLEIALDKVDMLGDFIEVEKMVDSAEQKDEALKECSTFLKKIDPELQIEKRKYGDLMQEIINKKK